MCCLEVVVDGHGSFDMVALTYITLLSLYKYK